MLKKIIELSDTVLGVLAGALIGTAIGIGTCIWLTFYKLPSLVIKNDFPLITLLILAGLSMLSFTLLAGALSLAAIGASAVILSCLFTGMVIGFATGFKELLTINWKKLVQDGELNENSTVEIRAATARNHIRLTQAANQAFIEKIKTLKRPNPDIAPTLTDDELIAFKQMIDDEENPSANKNKNAILYAYITGICTLTQNNIHKELSEEQNPPITIEIKEYHPNKMPYVRTYDYASFEGYLESKKDETKLTAIPDLPDYAFNAVPDIYRGFYKGFDVTYIQKEIREWKERVANREAAAALPPLPSQTPVPPRATYGGYSHYEQQALTWLRKQMPTPRSHNAVDTPTATTSPRPNSTTEQ